MRAELLYDPFALLQRLGEWALTHRRLRRLRRSIAGDLQNGHINSLELLDLLRPANPEIIYDIGAHIGTWTLLAKALFPSAEVHAFEPIRSHTEKFKMSVRGVPNIVLHEIALGSERSFRILHVTDFSDASSLLPLTALGREQWHLSEIQQIPIELQRLDDYAENKSLSMPDLLKLDVQGYELEVLKGATRALVHARAVIAEVSFCEFYRGQCRFDQVVSYLAECGLFLHAIGQRTMLGKPLVQSDLLFLRID